MTTDTTASGTARRPRRAPAVDAQCAAAVELARAAAAEVAGPGELGEHVGVEADADRVVTHFFACTALAYRGWRWAVTVARASRARQVTVDEVVLLPGPEAVLAPEWLPWSERLRPGDLGVGDLLPADPDDPRLDPGYAPHGDDDDAVALWELGLGRPRVLSPYGRELAAERWYDGEHGPGAAIAQAAPGRCGDCGFLLLLGGSLRRLFGVCANEMAPDDGRVVSLDHGCGAHSETPAAASISDVAPPVVGEEELELVTRSAPVTAAAVDTPEAAAADDAAGTAAAVDTPDTAAPDGSPDSSPDSSPDTAPDGPPDSSPDPGR